MQEHQTPTVSPQSRTTEEFILNVTEAFSSPRYRPTTPKRYPTTTHTLLRSSLFRLHEIPGAFVRGKLTKFVKAKPNKVPVVPEAVVLHDGSRD